MKLRPVYFWTSALFLFLAFAGLAYLGTFTRFLADDFCMAGDALHLGLPGMLAKWYTRWTGRFMFITFTGLFGLGGPRFAGWLPALVGATWLVGIWWAILPLIKRSGWPRPRQLAILASGLSLLVLLSSIPNLFQSFLWQNGMVNYSLPLIGLVYSAGIILRVWLERTRLLPTCAALFVLAFLSGGFTEVFSAMQVTFFALTLLISFTVRDRTTRMRLLPSIGAALLGGLAAMMVIIIAPGNLIRLQAVGNESIRFDLLRIITLSIQNMLHIFENYFIYTPYWALASIIPPFLAGWLFSSGSSLDQQSPASWIQNWPKRMALVLGAAFILVTAACAPVVYALNSYPDDRAIIIPQFVVVVAVMSISVMLGAGLRRLGILPDPAKRIVIAHALQTGILIVMILATGISVRRTARWIPEFQSFAKAWDDRASIIQEAADSEQSEITVVGGEAHFGIANLKVDPNNWVNVCMAKYYQIPQIRGR